MRQGGWRSTSAALLAILATVVALPVSAGSVEPAMAGAHIATLNNHFLPGDDEVHVPTLVVTRGSPLHLSNLEVFAAHDVTHEGCRSPVDAEPCRFASPTVNRAEGTVEVVGVDALAVGAYPFYCTVHPATMAGTLIIEESP